MYLSHTVVVVPVPMYMNILWPNLVNIPSLVGKAGLEPSIEL